MSNAHWIFISPHFDDVALSCGGLVWSLAQQNQIVEIWTLMAGVPSDEAFTPFAEELHRTWGASGAEVIRIRMAEDRAACQVLGAIPRHFHWQDAIYRRDYHSGEPIVTDHHTLFSKPSEPTLIAEITATLQQGLPASAQLVFPISLGNHIDHRVTWQVSQLFNLPVQYYADYPYILRDFEALTNPDTEWEEQPYYFGEAILGKWQEAVLCYASQLSSFWRDENEACLALRNYLAGGGGRLWHKRTARSAS